MDAPNFSKLKDVRERLEELNQDSLYKDNELVRCTLHRGSQHIRCRIVGVYLSTSSSKEEIVIDLFPEKD